MSKIDLTAGELITKFELQVNDITELSSEEELDLLNDVQQDLALEHQWEKLKKPATGALAFDSVTGLYYIPAPEDFSHFVENNMYTDNTMDIENNARPIVVFVGAAYQPFQVVNYSDRMQYRTRSGVCWMDPTVNRIIFPVAPSDTSFYVFDYIMIPPYLTTVDSVPTWIQNRFRSLLPYAMAFQNDILQLSNKAKSYEDKNRGLYADLLAKMIWQNDQSNMN